jgi:hypothetical protein
MPQHLDQSHDSQALRMGQHLTTGFAHARTGNTLELRLWMTFANRVNQRCTEPITGQLAGNQAYAQRISHASEASPQTNKS